MPKHCNTGPPRLNNLMPVSQKGTALTGRLLVRFLVLGCSGAIATTPASAASDPGGGVPPAEAPAEASAETPVDSTTPTFENADALLRALEHADTGLKTLLARINYFKTFAIQSDTQERRGTLYFEAESSPDGKTPPRRRFAVTFDELIVGDRSEKSTLHYAFDGEWVVEKTPDDHQFTKRQVVPPGETFDPLKIGEGPFPVPIGQKRAEILSRFEATLPPPAEGLENPNYVMFVEFNALVELLLKPKPGTPEADSFEEVRIWYQPTGHMLPLIAKTITPAGDESLVILTDPVVNKPIDESVFSTELPPADENWHVHISEYRRPVPG